MKKTPTEHKKRSAIDIFYLWALSLGLAVGWGAFVMPGATFFPLAGPVGTAIGFALGGLIMIAIAACFKYMIVRYPQSGGAYAFTRELLGFDHAFLASWALILAYMSILWANATAFILIGRYLAAPYIQWGFHYTVAGYDVYLSEILITIFIFILFAFIAVRDNRKGRVFYIVLSTFVLAASALLLIGGLSAGGSIANYTPAFSEASFKPDLQVFNIVIFAPWAYVGFEGISHSVEATSVSPKKYFRIMALALISAALIYILMAGVSLVKIPEGYSSWVDYIGEGTGGTVIQKFPVYYSVLNTLGTPGLVILIIAMVAALSTSMIGYYRILANLLSSMAADGLMPEKFSHTNKYGIHDVAVRAVAFVSLFIPLMGRVTISWIIDITTISVSIVYCYISICTLISARNNKDRKYKWLGIFGIVISILFFVFPIIPNPFMENTLSTRSYILLVGWSMLGLIFYWLIFRKDRQSRFGQSMIMWMLMLFLVLVTAVIWFQQTVMTIGDLSTPGADSKITQSTIIVVALIIAGLIIIYNIFTIMRRRSFESDIRRIQAEERSKAKTNLLSNMSHDIRTPMNAIIGYTALAKDPSAGIEEIRDCLDKIDASSGHLLELIDDILEMSSIEAGKMKLNEDVTDICRLVTDAADMFRQQMEIKCIRFNADISEVNDRYVLCDKTKMNRVLLNLLSNAYKFTPEKGTVSISLRENGEADPDNTASYTLRVKDTGIGMSEEFVRHVFDAFERERSSTVSRIQGSGLGMSITKSIIDMMGGKISVRSKQNVGTEFTIKLKMKLSDVPDENDSPARTAGIAGTAAGSADVPFKGLKLLLVDDMEINREMAKRILEKLGFEVETAQNGREAVEYVGKCDPKELDLILMDVQMPEMNGYEAASKIRGSAGKLSSVPIIALTADVFESDKQAAKKAGMDGHISKPLNIPAMIKEINRVLNL
ncbi:MAG: amino acid permease [Lachnospiraceae bacterium]|nr:amino acid permease [Lachnospiraceae bacterium]